MQAIVLRLRDHLEFDQIVTVLTEDHGRNDVLARGSKKVVSKNAALLQPAAYLDIGIAPGRRFDILTTVQAVTLFPQTRASLGKNLVATFAAAELARTIKPGDADPGLFRFVRDWLVWFETAVVSETQALDTFFEELLVLLGFGEGISLADEGHAAVLEAVRYHLEYPIEDWNRIEIMLNTAKTCAQELS